MVKKRRIPPAPSKPNFARLPDIFSAKRLQTTDYDFRSYSKVSKTTTNINLILTLYFIFKIADAIEKQKVIPPFRKSESPDEEMKDASEAGGSFMKTMSPPNDHNQSPSPPKHIPSKLINQNQGINREEEDIEIDRSRAQDGGDLDEEIIRVIF